MVGCVKLRMMGLSVGWGDVHLELAPSGAGQSVDVLVSAIALFVGALLRLKDVGQNAGKNFVLVFCHGNLQGLVLWLCHV